MSQRENGAVRDTASDAPDALGTPEVLGEDAAAQTTSVMGFDDLEEFRQAARDARIGETEADRVTPTAPTPSPFAPPKAPPPSPLQISRDPAAAPPEPPQTPLRGFGAIRAALIRSFREASWPKRATVVLLPFVIGMYAVNTFRRPPEPMPRPKTALAPSAAIVQAPASSTIDQTAAIAPPAKAGGAVAAQPGNAVEARPSGATLQRRAVDAFATGDFQKAAALYHRLATENPNQPAYAAASQIASDKASGLGHE